MGIPKVVGIEQEYAIKAKREDVISAFHASCGLVNAYAGKLGLRDPGVGMIWDYAHETPFQDIRGPDFGKRTGQEVISNEDNQLINAALPNGARLYTDHAHPEYSTPECLSARDAVACDKAGELILLDVLDAVNSRMPSSESEISLYKNNTDQQGHSYGCHENYLMDARAHEENLIRIPQNAVKLLVPFLVTRQIYAGSGKVGAERPDSHDTIYQLSQRADFMETIFSLETMYDRPLINTREEHHADAKRFRRLHLILGDANMCEFAAFLKIGSTQITLQMMEDKYLNGDFTLPNPLNTIKRVSERFNGPFELADGGKTTAMEIQRWFLERAKEYCRDRGEEAVPEADLILECWEYALEGLEQLQLSPEFDIRDDPMGLIGRLDWVLKLWLLNRYRDGKGLDWKNQTLKVLDLHYHNIDARDGFFYRLQEEGITERMLDDDEIIRFIREPPSDTRAYFRGKCIEKFPKEMHLVNWEVVGFDQGDVYRMIPLLNPLKGTREQFEEVFNQASDSAELLDLIQ